MKSKYVFRVPQKQISMAFSALMMITLMCIVLLTPSIMVPLAAAQDSIPVAIIHGDSHVSMRQIVYLDGTMSYDPKRRGLKFKWTIVETPRDSTAVLVDSTNTQAKFEADALGIFRVELVVNNGLVDSDPSYYTISVIE